MSERSYSHKSVGGQSSTGHSVHSATSGRANSLTGYGLGSTPEPPGLAPGLFILGSVPAIIRCWLTTTFKHDTMLYAAVCTGSYASSLDMRLVEQLGFQDQVTRSHVDGSRKIEMPIYFPEAIPVSSSSRSSSPAPQLPSLTVTFSVVDNGDSGDSRAIQIFLGSDMMRAHNADILFSSNQLTLYDDDQSKLRIPLVRPEDERSFNSLYVTSGRLRSASPQQQGELEQSEYALLKSSATDDDVDCHTDADREMGNDSKVNGASASQSENGSSGRPSLEQRMHLGLGRSVSTSKEPQDATPADATSRSVPSPAIWSNWRRDTERAGSGDMASGASSTYQRRDTGIKVLKKPGTRVLSTSNSQSSPSVGQSRFFDDGKRRASNVSEVESGLPTLKRSVSGDKAKENAPSLTRAPSSNPVGGASAFAWLNSKGVK